MAHVESIRIFVYGRRNLLRSLDVKELREVTARPRNSSTAGRFKCTPTVVELPLLTALPPNFNPALPSNLHHFPSET